MEQLRSSTPLLTERLAIRPLELADAEAVYRYRSDPCVSRYQSWEPRSVDEVRDAIASQAKSTGEPGHWLQLGLCGRQSGALRGDLAVRFLATDPRQAEIGITLPPESQGRGLAAEALRAILKHLFVERGVHRVIGSVDPRNAPSLALLERVGMRREAHHVESLWFKGEWADDVIYAMLRRELSSDERHEGLA